MLINRREAATTLLSLTQVNPVSVSGGTLRPIEPTQASYASAFLVERATRLLFVSGQTPTDREGRAPKGFGAQARLAWRNVETQLRLADMTLANLAKVTIFLGDRLYRAENTEIRRQILGPLSPALTVIIVDIFDEDWLIEIEAIACA
ncbi:RidA family protein [Sphingomonas alpina]|uniref:RidA family protein n=1 Tax=Sphingomonas alpina TaxID=653931 RepID=A0A7H0LN33_9SPHN|nr:RidA family protein [Sphingomonas alpina]QNQ11086.1 RidA family protein [Sphingomonas alpina]